MHALILLLLSAAPAPTSRTFQTDATPEVSVSNIHGSIRVEAVDGERVTVDFRQEGSAGDVARWRVEAHQEGDTVEVQVCCGECGKTVRRCEGGAVKTHLTLRVPKGAQLELSAVDADVQVKGVEGAQEVSTVNGKVELHGSAEEVSVSTVNGSVVLAPRSLAETEVSTVASNVRLQLPARANARVGFSAVGGSFNGRDVALGSVTETYGKGTHDIAVNTVTGALEVQTPRG
jgi:hypothetical protein